MSTGINNTEKKPDEQLSDAERAERARRFADEMFEKFQARRDSQPNPLAALKEGWSE